MKETTFSGTRLTLTKEERPIAKSWGSWWSYFGRMERTHGGFLILFGDWSGYRSSQSRITHIDWCSKNMSDNYRGTVQFTDGTTMSVWVRRVTRKQIIENKWRRNPTYESLIRKLISSGKDFYRVGEEKEVVA
jgi:hypothetical protein